MISDHISETIAHFIGIFEITVEEARLRAEYDKFKLARDLRDDLAKLPVIDVDRDAPHRLGDAEAGVRWAPSYVALGAEWLLPASAAGPAPDPQGDLGEPVRASHDPGGLGSVHSFEISSSTSAPVPAMFYGPVEPPAEFTPPVFEFASPVASIATIITQANRLSDVDRVDMGGGGDLAAAHAVASDAELAALVETAASLRMIDMSAPPSSSAAIAEIAAGFGAAARAEAPSVAGADVLVDRGGAHDGYIVNGARTDEAPVFDDLAPARSDPDPDPDAEDGADDVAAHRVVAGENTLLNDAVVQVSATTAPLISVLGNTRDVEIISQTNVRSGGLGDAAPSTDLNIARIAHYDSPGPNASGSGDDWAGIALTRHEGDLISFNWARQYNYVLDHDVATVSFQGAETWLGLGGNSAANTVSLQALGHLFDHIIVGGDKIAVSMVRQSNVLLGEDDVAPGIATGAVSAGGDLLWNRAEIHRAGNETHHAMSAEHKALVEDLRDGLPDPQALKAEIYAGLDLPRVLVVDGSLVDFTLLDQKNVLGDRDLVKAAAREAMARPDAEVSVVTGANALINSGAIARLGVDTDIHTAGARYSDALIHQASFVTDDASDLVTADPRALANEAFAFLAEGMVKDEAPEAPPGPGDSYSDATSPDLMQTMLS